jgi:hypothetical protein
MTWCTPCCMTSGRPVATPAKTTGYAPSSWNALAGTRLPGSHCRPGMTCSGRQFVGEAGAHAAWLLAQHAPPDFQEQCLPLIEDAVARGDASRRDLAYLTDRVLMDRGQPQIYGTQYLVKDGTLTLWTVQEPGGLDERRGALGLEPEAQNRARLRPPKGSFTATRTSSPASNPLPARRAVPLP